MSTLQPTSSKRMPVVFVGHGSPMNAIEQNSFTETLSRLGKEIPRPKAILCVSAHWMSEGSWVTEMARPKTIHDFYGFPKELFDVQYPAQGSPELAKLIQDAIKDPKINLDHKMWGLDHGTWSVLKHMYPNADVPVLQLSLYMEQPAEYHYKLGQELKHLRDQGVLIIGSGNIVHNLRRIRWEEGAEPFEWASEFDEWVKGRIAMRDYRSLIYEATESVAGKLSIPTAEHWYPLFYVLGASDSQDVLRFEYEGIEMGSISMRSLSLGLT
ncbi:MAG: 4,5-DOPA dioxygenase extradiol [Bdellovibrionota bacterium]